MTESPSPNISTPIDGLPVADSWKDKFRLIEKAGPYTAGRYANIKALTAKERQRITFNTPAFVFSFLYYFAKGMAKKGVVIASFGFFWVAALSYLEERLKFRIPSVAYYIPTSAASAMLATPDYYRKMVHREQMWQSLRIFDRWPACVLLLVGSVAILGLGVHLSE